ncbi:helix-turn-helix domain-containing protein [Bacillus pinisoli]|uniref:helix-turn-helix domain-containing protein n=1 Tax=Bacillus pinisoli TaxID=2901866 RepID=UPI001FF1C5EE|nr:helix-turn-helix domain-containing protein [Bacillus pinisoli]
MKYLYFIILYGLEKINGERSIFSIYHLYKGKRSSQTIQDAKLFQLELLFGVIPGLKRDVLEAAIKELSNTAMIAQNEKESFIVTNKGKEYLQTFSLPQGLSGWRFSGDTKVFWERLSLTIQCLSYLIHHEPRFIPINRDQNILQWVKLFLRRQAVSREQVASHLYDELYSILFKLDEKQSMIFVYKLTGINRVGSTNDQIANMLEMDVVQVSIYFQSVLHELLHQVEKFPTDFPLLAQLATTITNKTVPLTQSTTKTLELLMIGKSVEEIASIRLLKKNTIEDHIVEIALMNPSFDISPFLDEEKYVTILECIQTVKSNQLKLIKQHLPVEASYFEIRLALAKIGGAHGTT